jgi:DNA-binding MarR family transcriptional regulator
MGVKHEASRGPATKTALAREVWRSLFDFVVATRSEHDAILERQGLSQNDSKALLTLEPEGLSMNELATVWNCDASSATWLVDRLEKLGLAERRSHPKDRRVKLVGLTADGV